MPCIHVPDPLDNGGSGADDAEVLAISASVVFGILVIAGLVGRAVYMVRNGAKLGPYVLPTSRSVGLQPTGAYPDAPVSIPKWDLRILCAWTILDAWFRSAAFAVPEFSLSSFASEPWVDLFSPLLVDFHSHAAWITLFSFGALFMLMASLLLYSNRFVISWGHRYSLPYKVTVLLRAGHVMVRFAEGLFLPIAFLMLDPWVCQNFESGERFVTGDCDASLECHGGKHYTVVAFSCIALLGLYLSIILPVRTPVSKHSIFAFGIPHLMPATQFLRLALAWSAKVFRHIDVCGSLWISVLSNLMLFFCVVLALDSRRLKLPAPAFALIVACELWVLSYSALNALAYGWETNSACGATLLAFLFLALLALVLLLARRAYNAHQAAIYILELERLRLEEAKKSAVVVARAPDSRVFFSVTGRSHHMYSYQWKQNGVPLIGERSSVLIRDESDLGNSAEICCFVTRRQTTFPVINSHPKDQDVSPGDTCSLAVETNAPDGYTYQWVKDGRKIPGATDPSFTLSNIGKDDLGTYSCIVANANGETVRTKPCAVAYSEDALRRIREEEERRRREAEEAARRAREEEERRRRQEEEAARRAREEEERRRRAAEEEERRRREAEEAARRAKEEAEAAERRAKEEAERLARLKEEEERKRLADLAADRAAREAQRELDAMHIIEPRLVRAEFAALQLAWDAPDVYDPSKLIYCVTAAEWDDDPSDDDPPEKIVCFPTTRADGSCRWTFDTFHGEPIDPNEGFQFQVAYGLLDDDSLHEVMPAGVDHTHGIPPVTGVSHAGAGGGAAGGADGTDAAGEKDDHELTSEELTAKHTSRQWYGEDGPICYATTAMPDERVVLLKGRYPRIWMLQPFTFETNKAILHGNSLKDLSLVVKLMADHRELSITVEGHVNFGQSHNDALRLSERRAKAIKRKLEDSGVPPSMLSTVGCGYKYPRFPRKAKTAFKNRRVEFRVTAVDGKPTGLARS